MRTRDILRQARKDGRQAGLAAASWVFDGNTSKRTFERIANGIADGDPEVLDSLRGPNLSGEYADDPTPRSLAADYDLAEDDPRAEWLIDDLATAWEDAASLAFWHEVERAAIAGAR